jgi:propanol-preferring alcohol dehydrogenase
MPNTEVTYRAVHAVSPGKLELTRKPLADPLPGYVRIRVEACGVCHTDATTVEGVFPIAWPRVPGHEAVGVIDMLGAGVEGWVVGQRVVARPRRRARWLPGLWDCSARATLSA